MTIAPVSGSALLNNVAHGSTIATFLHLLVRGEPDLSGLESVSRRVLKPTIPAVAMRIVATNHGVIIRPFTWRRGVTAAISSITVLMLRGLMAIPVAR